MPSMVSIVCLVGQSIQFLTSTGILFPNPNPISMDKRNPATRIFWKFIYLTFWGNTIGEIFCVLHLLYGADVSFLVPLYFALSILVTVA